MSQMAGDGYRWPIDSYSEGMSERISTYRLRLFAG